MTDLAQSPLAHIPNPGKRLQELSWLLGQFEDATRRQEFMVACFADQYPPVRQAAARLLSQEPPGEAIITVLIGLLDASTSSTARFIPKATDTVKLAALAALRGVSHPELGALYARLVAHEDSDIRYQCMVNLFDLEISALPPHMEEVLRAGLGDQDAEVAVIASQFAAERGYLALIDAIDMRRSAAVQGGQLRLQFALAQGRLLSQRGDDHMTPPHTARAWVDALEQEFVRGLHNEVASSASGAALVDLALGLGQREMAAAPLRKVLSKWLLHPLLKVEAAAQLTRLGDAQGLSYLSDVIDSKRKDARGHAITVAGRLHIEPLYGQVARIAASTHDYHNDTAILALANYNTKAARAQLEELARTHADEDLRALSRQALEAPTDAPITFFSLEQSDPS